MKNLVRSIRWTLYGVVAFVAIACGTFSHFRSKKDFNQTENPVIRVTVINNLASPPDQVTVYVVNEHGGAEILGDVKQNSIKVFYYKVRNIHNFYYFRAVAITPCYCPRHIIQTDTMLDTTPRGKLRGQIIETEEFNFLGIQTVEWNLNTQILRWDVL